MCLTHRCSRPAHSLVRLAPRPADYTSLPPSCAPAHWQAAATFSSVGAEARLDVSATGAMAIRGFSFIEIRSIAGSLTLNPKAVTVTAANLRAQARFVNTNVAVELAYDAPQKAFGLMAAIDEFGLQVCWGRGHRLL